MDQSIKVLNHGHVRLVEHMGSDLSIVRNARVSYDAEYAQAMLELIEPIVPVTVAALKRHQIRGSEGPSKDTK